MKSYTDILANSFLFNEIQPIDFKTILHCLKGQIKAFEDGNYIAFPGEEIRNFGMILAGEAMVCKEDILGYKTIVTKVEKGNLFAETFAFSGRKTLPVSVIAVGPVTVLFMNHQNILASCEKNCSFHRQLMENLIAILADKNIILQEKIELQSARTIEDKLIHYLSGEATKKGSYSFHIPFNRQELADFLSVNRSALSRVMSELQEKGVIQYAKNKFILYPDILAFYTEGTKKLR